jgi:hypothetical protein
MLNFKHIFSDISAMLTFEISAMSTFEISAMSTFEIPCLSYPDRFLMLDKYA